MASILGSFSRLEIFQGCDETSLLENSRNCRDWNFDIFNISFFEMKNNWLTKKLSEVQREEGLKNTRAKLENFTDVDFNLFIPKTISKLSQEEICTIQFGFWFCHIVERDLDAILQYSFKNMESIMGKTPKELVDFIKERYKVDLEKIDPGNQKYDRESITFNDRIDIVEKIMGKSEHTIFLRKIKKLRNDISHGRINNLTYEGEDLSDNKVKRQLMLDYIKQALNVENMKSEGGIVNDFTEKQKERVNRLWQEWLDKNKN